MSPTTTPMASNPNAANIAYLSSCPLKGRPGRVRLHGSRFPQERGHMGVPAEWTHWAVGYAPSRVALDLLARRGDPLAQLMTIDRNPVDDIYPLIEQVRRRGRMSRIVSVRGWVTADSQIVRDVLRDGRFRTLKPRDRSSFRLGQWILAKTDPQVLNPIEPPSMLVTDPPEHTRLRRPVARAFTPRALERLRDRV